MGLLGAGSLCNKTTFWECMRVEGSFPVSVSAQPYVVMWDVAEDLKGATDASEGAEDLRRRSAKPPLVFQPGLYICCIPLALWASDWTVQYRSSRRNSRDCGRTRGASGDNTQRPRVWVEGLVDMFTPSSSGWGDLLINGSSQFLDIETVFCQ